MPKGSRQCTVVNHVVRREMKVNVSPEVSESLITFVTPGGFLVPRVVGVRVSSDSTGRRVAFLPAGIRFSKSLSSLSSLEESRLPRPPARPPRLIRVGACLRAVFPLPRLFVLWVCWDSAEVLSLTASPPSWPKASSVTDKHSSSFLSNSCTTTCEKKKWTFKFVLIAHGQIIPYLQLRFDQLRCICDDKFEWVVNFINLYFVFVAWHMLY